MYSHSLTIVLFLGLAASAGYGDDKLSAPAVPTVELLQTLPETEAPESAEKSSMANDEREEHWDNLGYVLRFNHSVSQSDFGRTGEDFLTDEEGWANGNPTYSNWIDESLISFTDAPDGSPAMRSIMYAGQQQSLNWRGQQLGQDNTDKDAVFSIQIWMESPRSTQSYIGAGHYWGSTPGVFHTGGAATNFPDSWSMRAVHALDGTIRGYAYWALPSSAASYGDVIHGTQQLPLDQWVTIESEVIQNLDPNASDGRLSTFVNYVLSAEKINRVRRTADTYPKGMGMLIRNNARAKQTETIYIRNWRIYTRP